MRSVLWRFIKTLNLSVKIPRAFRSRTRFDRENLRFFQTQDKMMKSLNSLTNHVTR